MKLTKNDIQQRLPKQFIHRTLYQDIQTVMNEDEVIIIYGARQVGKSSLVFKLAEQYANTHPIHYYSLDEVDNPDLQSTDRLIASLQTDIQSHQKVVVIIDEAQRKENVGLFIKTIYDQRLPIKFILTGSASFSIKSSIQEPLTGRKFEFHLSPLSLVEIFNYYHLDYTNTTNITTQLEKVLREYILYGGYPQIFFTPDYQLKKKRLMEIVNTYVHRDLTQLFQIQDTNAVRKVTTYIAENIGNILSVEKITSLGGLKRSLVETIINALTKTFTTYSLPPLSSNAFVEISKRPKLYFHDTGLRNAFLNKLDENLIINDLVSLFENVIGNQLYQQHPQTLHYWRNINQTEVDFVYKKNDQFHGIETKYTWSSLRKPQSLLRFEKDYQATGAIIHKDNYWKCLV